MKDWFITKPFTNMKWVWLMHKHDDAISRVCKKNEEGDLYCDECNTVAPQEIQDVALLAEVDAMDLK